MKPRVYIPASQLASQLERAETLRRHLLELLDELESAAGGQPGDHSWRHHPTQWLKSIRHS